MLFHLGMYIYIYIYIHIRANSLELTFKNFKFLYRPILILTLKRAKKAKNRERAKYDTRLHTFFIFKKTNKNNQKTTQLPQIYGAK